MGERGTRQDECRDDRAEGGEEPHASEANAVAGASLAASVPLYEYRCPNGHLFEVIHRMTEDGLEEEGRFVRMGGAPGMARARVSETVDLGFELGNQKRMGVVVTVEYRVEGFTAPASAAGA